MQNTTQAPGSKLYRTVTANDSLPVTDKKQGLNCGQYNSINVEIVPTSDNPTVTVQTWSETAGRFIQDHTAFTRAGLGAGIPYTFSYPCDGRLVFIGVTGGSGAGNTKISVSGFDMAEGTG